MYVQKFVLGAVVTLCLVVSQFAAAQQWSPVNNGLPTTVSATIISNAETLYASVYGGGVFKSLDYGDTWTSLNAGLPTTQVSALEMAPYLLAGTDSGVYMRIDETTWTHLSTVGMTNTLVRFLALTPDSSNPRLNVGTPGGIFRQLHISDWESANNGLVGEALDVRSLSAYSSSGLKYGITGTADGVYMTFDNYASWQKMSNGLTGSSLHINKVMNLDSPASLAATDSGLFATLDTGKSWIPIIPSELISASGTANYPGTGLGLYFFGVKGFVTTNFSSWPEINMTGVTGGRVLDFATTQNYIYVTTQTGGVFRKALADLTSAEEIGDGIPQGFNLSQNFPNPFNPATRISFTVAKEGVVSLIVYDMLGREVANLLNETKQPGAYTVTWNANGVSSGVYMYRLVAGGQAAMHKMVLVR
jgi:hypothetical protein